MRRRRFRFGHVALVFAARQQTERHPKVGLPVVRPAVFQGRYEAQRRRANREPGRRFRRGHDPPILSLSQKRRVRPAKPFERLPAVTATTRRAATATATVSIGAQHASISSYRDSEHDAEKSRFTFDRPRRVNFEQRLSNRSASVLLYSFKLTWIIKSKLVPNTLLSGNSTAPNPQLPNNEYKIILQFLEIREIVDKVVFLNIIIVMIIHNIIITGSSTISPCEIFVLSELPEIYHFAQDRYCFCVHYLNII